MVLIENDAFLAELTKLFQATKLCSSVLITMKKYDGHKKPQPRKGRDPLPEPVEHFCLIRAKINSKKLSTIVHSRDVNKFQLAYVNLLRGNIDGLKKIKKTKVKSKATQ